MPVVTEAVNKPKETENAIQFPCWKSKNQTKLHQRHNNGWVPKLKDSNVGIVLFYPFYDFHHKLTNQYAHDTQLPKETVAIPIGRPNLTKKKNLVGKQTNPITVKSK